MSAGEHRVFCATGSAITASIVGCEGAVGTRRASTLSHSGTRGSRLSSARRCCARRPPWRGGTAAGQMDRTTGRMDPEWSRAKSSSPDSRSAIHGTPVKKPPGLVREGSIGTASDLPPAGAPPRRPGRTLRRGKARRRRRDPGRGTATRTGERNAPALPPERLPEDGRTDHRRPVAGSTRPGGSAVAGQGQRPVMQSTDLHAGIVASRRKEPASAWLQSDEIVEWTPARAQTPPCPSPGGKVETWPRATAAADPSSTLPSRNADQASLAECRTASARRPGPSRIDRGLSCPRRAPPP